MAPQSLDQGKSLLNDFLKSGGKFVSATSATISMETQDATSQDQDTTTNTTTNTTNTTEEAPLNLHHLAKDNYIFKPKHEEQKDLSDDYPYRRQATDAQGASKQSIRKLNAIAPSSEKADDELNILKFFYPQTLVSNDEFFDRLVLGALVVNSK